jgi:hypothetical protein
MDHMKAWAIWAIGALERGFPPPARETAAQLLLIPPRLLSSFDWLVSSWLLFGGILLGTTNLGEPVSRANGRNELRPASASSMTTRPVRPPQHP